jgi:hypothetical protein
VGGAQDQSGGCIAAAALVQPALWGQLNPTNNRFPNPHVERQAQQNTAVSCLLGFGGSESSVVGSRGFPHSCALGYATNCVLASLNSRV